MKKAQITLFIIIGILILAVAGILIYISATLEKPQQPVPLTTDRAPLKDYASQCLAILTEQAARLTALQGGYLNPRGSPLYGEKGDFYPVHYYYESMPVSYNLIGRECKLPDKKYIEQAIEKYVLVELDSCLNLESFQGFAIKKPVVDAYEDSIKVDYALDITATISEDSISVKAHYPILLERSGQKILLEEFSTSVPIRIGRAYDIVEQLLKEAGAAKATNRLYRITDRCDALASPDNLINIYFEPNPYRRDYLLRVIDAKPLNEGKPPFKFHSGIRNVEITGECVG